MRPAETESTTPPRALTPFPASPWPVLGPAQALGLSAAWAMAMALVAVFAHPTALYLVETDLVGEYLPAAGELARGVLNVSHYAFKGPGYPLLLAALAAPFHGDVALAARLLSPLAAGLAAWLAWALARAAMGEGIATFTLLAMLAMPAQARYAIEAGTDAPALALMLGSTMLLLRRGGARTLLGAGALAGYAMLTRGNAFFLLPCAAIVLIQHPRRTRSLAAYALGVAVPLAAWFVIATRAGGLPADRNYLNVAWELYGQGVPWEQFEASAGARFHSMLEVLRYAPARAALHVGRNLVTYRAMDLQQLLTPWLGIAAVPGLVLLARESRARAWLAHTLACAVVLAPVFYNPRFALYLLPLYAAAAGAAMQWLAIRVTTMASARAWPAFAARHSVPALGLAAILGSGAVAAIDVSGRLADAPHEVRIAGQALARSVPAGAAIVARKPHIAWYAHMRYVPFPTAPPLRQLAATARAAGAGYLFFSGLEMVMRPGYGVLADSGLALPGLNQIAWGRLPRGHFYAVYRLTGAAADSAAFTRDYLAALARYERRRPGSPEAALFVAAQLLELGAPAAALERLDALDRAGVRIAAVERYRSTALLALGRLDESARACRAALILEPPAAWHWARLGEVSARQSRFGEARDLFAKAVEVEPASLTYLELLGRAQVALRDYPAAAATFERAVRLAPHDADMRIYAMGAWQLAGNPARVHTLYVEGLGVGTPAAALTGTR